MNIQELKNIGIKKLKEQKIEDPIIKSEKLLEFIFNMNKIELLINYNKVINEEKEKCFFNYIDEIIKGKPVQYIIKNQEFMKLNFYVDDNVLIPQPDTEILVENTIKILEKLEKNARVQEKSNLEEKLTVLDLCTGSGAIGISIKKYMKNAIVYVSDISSKALEIAKINAKNNNVNINFIQSDMFEKFNEMRNLKFDVIVSNPPYIETDNLETLPKEVQAEPKLALDGGKDGLKYYRKIADKGYMYLKDKGYILMEIGYNQNISVPELFKNNNEYKNIEIFKDLSNIDRVIKIEKS